MSTQQSKSQNTGDMPQGYANPRRRRCLECGPLLVDLAPMWACTTSLPWMQTFHLDGENTAAGVPSRVLHLFMASFKHDRDLNG